MDPIQINITLGLNEKTIAVLQAFAGGKSESPKPETKPEAKPAATETKPAPRKVETKPAAKPEVKDPLADTEPEPVAESAEPVAAKPREISDEELRAVLYKARKSSPTAAQTIKNVIFPEFGIATSIECPMEQRAALVDRLNKIES